MTSNLDKYRQDLDRLIAEGELMSADLGLQVGQQLPFSEPELKALRKKVADKFLLEYQAWYSEAAAAVKQLLPDRYSEFVGLYRPDPKRKNLTGVNYAIQDWLNGLRALVNAFDVKDFNDGAAVFMRFSTQRSILKATRRRFESSLFDIRQLVQADLFDSELAASRELARQGFGRAAGAVAGVVLEKHLGEVAQKHGVVIRKKHPTVADLNDPLKESGVIDIPVWRQIQRLADVRNLCDHNKHREPTVEEVDELISGIERLTKTLF